MNALNVSGQIPDRAKFSAIVLIKKSRIKSLNILTIGLSAESMKEGGSHPADFFHRN
jgi:hypothetical protein